MMHCYWRKMSLRQYQCIQDQQQNRDSIQVRMKRPSTIRKPRGKVGWHLFTLCNSETKGDRKIVLQFEKTFVFRLSLHRCATWYILHHSTFYYELHFTFVNIYVAFEVIICSKTWSNDIPLESLFSFEYKT